MTWTHVTDLPSGHLSRDLGAVGVGGLLYVDYCRNTDGSEHFASYNPATNTWTALTAPPLPSGVKDATLIPSTTAGKLLRFESYSSDAVYEYDIATDTWTAKTSWPLAGANWRQFATDGAVVYAAKIAFSAPNGITNIAVYDIATDTWDSGSVLPIPTTSLGYGFGSLHHLPAHGSQPARLVFINGWMNQAAPAGEAASLDLSNIAGGWTSETADPLPREIQAKVDGLPFAMIIGGDNDTDPSLVSCEAYDPATNTWSDLPDLPLGLDNAAACILDSYVYIVGGRNDTAGVTGGVYRQPLSDIIPPPTLPMSASGETNMAGVASLEGRLVATGGIDSGGTASMGFVYPPPLVPTGTTVNPRWRRSYTYTPPSVDTATWQMVKQTRTLATAEKWGTWQIIVDGVDVTFHRGARTRMQELSRAQPGGPERVVLIFPRAFPFEAPGGSALPWLRDNARVTIRKRNPDGTLSSAIAWEYDVHRLIPIVNGDDWHWEAECKGFLHADGERVHRPPTTFFTDDAQDIGKRVAQILNFPGHRYAHVSPVTTGILTSLRGSLSQSKLGAVLDLLSVAWTSDGRQWTLAADPGPGRKMRIRLPTTSVDYHIALGADGLDLSGITPGGGVSAEGDEIPTVVFGEYVTPDGYRSQNLKYPHAHDDTAPPYPGPPVYNPGASTTGFAPFADWLRDHGYAIHSLNTYDTRDEDEVVAAQGFLGITQDGVVGAQTWGTAFNTGANVGDLGAAFYAPLAADPRTQPRKITPDGQDLGPNPLYDPSVPVREVYINFGSGVTRREVLRAARQIVARNSSGYNYAGQISMTCDPEECSRLQMLEGKILAIRYFAGSGSTGVPFHISRVVLDDPDSDECRVTLDVDTKLRDAPTVTALIENRRDAKHDPARQIRRQETGKLTQTTQPIFDRDNAAGKIYWHTIQGGFWRVVRFPAGSYGTFVELIAKTSPHAEIVGGLFVKPVTANFMAAKVGNPLDPANARPFDTSRADLRAAGFIQGWGSGAQPGGYSDGFTGAKSEGDPLTGKIEDDQSTDWASFNPPWLYWVEYADRTTDVTVTFRNAPEQV